MTILNTAKEWQDNILWVNETKTKLEDRNATVPKENSRSGATIERFYKRYIHSLVALSFTDEYQYIVDEHNISDFLINSINHDFISKHFESRPESIDSNLDLLEIFKKIPALKQENPTHDIYSLLFQDNIFKVKPKVLKFVLYFMTSFYNLNDLINDYNRIFVKRKKQVYEPWEKTSYFNQTIAEIYREDFLFTMLLEVLNLSVISNGQFTVKEIIKIYNGYLKNEPIDKNDFTYKYLYNLQYNDLIKDVEPGDEIFKWFGHKIWQNKVDGKINLTSSKTTIESVANFMIPKDIAFLNSAEAESALKLIVDLFVININYDAVNEDLRKNDTNFMPSDVMKDAINIQKEYSKVIAIKRIQQKVFFRKENELHISQHRRTLYQSEIDEDGKISHYILNPKISRLVKNISKRTDASDLSIDFIQVLT